MGVGVGALAMGIVLANNADNKQSATTWTGVAASGGALSGLSLTGLIIGLAAIASRPTPQPVINIQPTLTQDAKLAGGGVAVSGTW
jgi:hypothetical protein